MDSPMPLAPGAAFPAGRRAVPAAGAACLAVFLLAAACGQQDPTFSPGGGPGPIEEGTIIVSSSTPGAEISLDGESTGKVTPDTLANVAAGPHRVSVYLPGYFTASDTLTVEADSVYTLTFVMQLIPTTGSVAVTAPYPAGILLDGTPTGSTAPDTLAGIEPGAHSISLVLAGFRPQPEQLEVTVEVDQVATAAFELLVPKKILCEDFSNFACMPCPQADEALHEVVTGAPAGRLVTINPHGWFPGVSDPFYQFNIVTNRSRVLFYMIYQLPTIYVDGLRVADAKDPVSIQARVDERPQEAAPLAIGVGDELAGNEYRMTVDVWGVEPVASNDLVLFTCVVETEATLDPAGPNGQVHYTNVLREILPRPATEQDPGGQALAVSSGSHETFAYTYDIRGGVDPGHLAVIAFVQDTVTKEVVQTGTTIEP